MYTLRTINKDGVVKNISLGPSYSVVYAKAAPEEFLRTQEACKHADAQSPETFAFVIEHAGANVHPVHEAYQHYIMTESGRTFERITKL